MDSGTIDCREISDVGTYLLVQNDMNGNNHEWLLRVTNKARLYDLSFASVEFIHVRTLNRHKYLKQPLPITLSRYEKAIKVEDRLWAEMILEV